MGEGQGVLLANSAFIASLRFPLVPVLVALRRAVSCSSARPTGRRARLLLRSCLRLCLSDFGFIWSIACPSRHRGQRPRGASPGNLHSQIGQWRGVFISILLYTGKTAKRLHCRWSQRVALGASQEGALKAVIHAAPLARDFQAGRFSLPEAPVEGGSFTASTVGSAVKAVCDWPCLID